jgi:HK97 gp10 family phage protein
MAGISGSFSMDAREFERGLRRWAGRLSRESKEATRRTGIRVQNEARRLAPVDTGRLRSSIVHRVEERGARFYDVSVGTNVNYAEFVEKGTRRHFIRPKNGQYLKFQYMGRTVYTKLVDHPGTKAQPFLAPAIAMADAWLREELARAGRRVR